MSNLGSNASPKAGASDDTHPGRRRYVLEQTAQGRATISAASRPANIIRPDYATTATGSCATSVLAVVQSSPAPVPKSCHRFDPLRRF